MSLPTRKILAIILLLAIAAVIGYFMYLAFFKPAPKSPLEEQLPSPVGGLPTAGPAGELGRVSPETGLPTPGAVEQTPAEPAAPDEVAAGSVTRVSALTSESAEAPYLLSDGSLAYYDRAKSKFYKIGSDGRIIELDSKNFYNVEKVNWSPSGNKAILEYPDGSKISYDFASKRQSTLPKEWQDFSFNSSGDQIAFKHMAVDKENRWLATASFDGSGMYLVEPLGENADKVQVNWSPTGQVVANYWESIDANRQEIFFVGLYGENFKSTVVNGHGFKGEWTPDGQKLFYSVYDSTQGFTPNLWLVSASGEDIGANRRDLGVQTWVDKCALSSDGQYAYCAVPQSMPEGAGLYPELTYDIPDNFYRINLSNGFQELLAQPYGDYSADYVELSSDSGLLYFRDINTGQLYEIKLK